MLRNCHGQQSPLDGQMRDPEGFGDEIGKQRQVRVRSKKSAVVGVERWV